MAELLETAWVLPGKLEVVDVAGPRIHILEVKVLDDVEREHLVHVDLVQIHCQTQELKEQLGTLAAMELLEAKVLLMCVEAIDQHQRDCHAGILDAYASLHCIES